MIIACLGDSLTEGDNGVYGKRCIANVQKENYPYFLSKIFNAEVRNFGKCGFTATNYLNYYKEGNVNLDNADVIIIMLGTNGGHDDINETQANIDYKELIDLCQKDAPRAKLILCTPPHATSNPEYSNCGHADQVEKATLFVRKLANENNIPMIDVALCEQFNADNEHIMQPNDGLHFGEIGYRTLAEFIAVGVRNILNI